MARGKTMSERIRSADGRIKIATLSGVSVLVALIALLVGVLPVFASHPEAVPLDEGGGPGKCFVETGGLPSAAGNQFHIQNPTPGTHTSADGVIEITVYDVTRPPEAVAGRVFDFDVISGSNVVYDVIVNGGPKTLHYDYDGNGGPVTDDDGLHAPNQTPNKYFNLSHINLCYDIPGLAVEECDLDAIREEGDGVLTAADLQIFQNRLYDCTSKRVLFAINEDDTATVEFQGDGTDTVAGRLDFYKEFGDASALVPLQYNGPGPFVDVQWCDVGVKDTTPDANGLFDGDQFDDVLETDEYPSLDGVLDGEVQATACKVNEDENADGDQHTVVYFEFVDPNFR
jgi:hypothetical protein